MFSRFTVLLVFLFLLAANSYTINAQEKLPDSELYLIHEDVIYPYMTDKYEKAASDFAGMMKESNVEGSYTALQTDIFTYSYVTPVKDYEGLAKYFDMRSNMMEKVGKDKFTQVMSGFDGCYASHKNFLLTLRNDLSYKAKYGLNPEEGANFRHLDYVYPMPGKEAEMIQILKEYQALYSSKNIEQGYRVYIGGIGTDMPMVLFVQPAKSQIDWATFSEEQEKLLGEEGGNLWRRAMAITMKFEHHSGMMRPDLYYKSK